MNPHHDAMKKARELTRQNAMPYAVNLAHVLREMNMVRAAPSAGPYATGGGGTVLEHRVGALMLSHLLTGMPVPALGDHITPTHVRFQGNDISRVDDILVRGRSALGTEHLLFVGVRRQPRLVPSEAKSVQLVGAFLDVVVRDWPLLRSGRRRLALAVVSACQPAHQLGELAVVAAAAASPAEFRRRMTEGGYANRAMRGRLVQLDALVAAALSGGWSEKSGLLPAELTWRLLSRLSVMELRLEGADLSDRTTAVGHLRPLTPLGLAWQADALFSRLVELVGIFAPSGSELDLPTLTAHLDGLSCFVPPAGRAVTSGAAAVPGTPQRVRALQPRKRAGARSRQDAVLWSRPAVSSAAVQPVLSGELLVVRDGYWLLGFDRATGDPTRPMQTAYGDPPVIGGGQVFVTDRARRIVPVDLRAEKRGRPLPARMSGGAGVVERGTLFAAAPDARVHAIDLASQVLLWTLPVSGVPVAAPRVHAGKVFLQTGSSGYAGEAAEDSSLWAFGTDGMLQWVHAEQEGDVLYWAAGDERVYVVSRDRRTGMHRVTALDVHSGQLHWQRAFDSVPVGKPVLAGGVLYLTTADACVIALDAYTGQERWRTGGDASAVAAAHVRDAVVFLGLQQPGCLVALDAATGAELLRRRTSGSFTSGLFSALGVVYGGHRGGVLHGWDTRSRREVWRAEVMWDEARQGAPLIVDNRAYVMGSNGKLHALSLRC
ncbi:outer membrane protein assembly factor BamB family protein [Streptomyces narbonensis]|uniref:outer membrane protein assembly factor BamB family protein n=1 Tax=Streptomyces narbonensis TaxID=67333 RepID=UPI0033D3AA39